MRDEGVGRVGCAETGSREPSPPSCTAGLGPAGFDPARMSADLKQMLLATPDYRHALLTPTKMTIREWEIATTSGLYVSVYNQRRDEWGFRLSPKGRKLRAAIAIEARRAIDSEAGVVACDESAGPKDIARKEQP